MKLSIIIILGLLVGAIFLGSHAVALMDDADNVKATYEGATVGCTVCHVEGNFKEVNSYGKDYNDAGRSAEAVVAIAENDSDGDGVKNADEIKAGTNPGDAESK